VDSSDIFEKMIKFGSSYEIWTRLSTEYYWDTVYVFVYQITNLTSLSIKFSTSDSLASIISYFQTE
jgi:hypothetical protein